MESREKGCLQPSYGFVSVLPGENPDNDKSSSNYLELLLSTAIDDL